MKREASGRQDPFLERRLLPPAARVARDLLPAGGLVVLLPEFTTEHGVIDVLGCAIDPIALAERLRYGPTPPLRSMLTGVVASHLQRRRVATIPQLVALTQTTDRAVRRAVRALAVRSMVEQDGNRIFVTPVLGSGVIQSAVAVELKVEHWKRAFQQAVQHRLLAEETYVALEARFVFRAFRSADTVAGSDIGLIAVDAEAAVATVLRRSKHRRYRSLAHRLLASEEVVRRLAERPAESPESAAPAG